MILIVGGTGSLGSATVHRLLEKGNEVRVMTRTPQRASRLKELGAEIVQGNLINKASLQRACAGADKVITAAHAIRGYGREESKYVDLQGHKDLIDVAKSAGARHFVYTSAYSFGDEYDSIPFYRFKHKVEQYLQTSGLNYTILRPTLFMESHAEIAIGRSVLEKGQVTLFGRGENPRNFVSADDAAQFVVMALEGSELNGKTVDIGGPENLTNMDVVRVYEELAGRGAVIRHIPLWKLQVKYRLFRLFDAGLSQIMQFNLYADTQHSTFDAAPMLAQYPVKLTRLADWARLRVM